MALSEVQLEARIAAIRNARDSGVLLVRHGDTSTQFRSLAEMNSILADLEAELAAAQGTTRQGVRYVRQNSKGF